MNTINIILMLLVAVVTATALECFCNQGFADANPAEGKFGLQAGFTECKANGSHKICEVTKARCDADTSTPVNCSALIKMVAKRSGQELQPYCYTQSQPGGLQGCGWLASAVAERCDRGASRQHWVRRCNADKCNAEGGVQVKAKCDRVKKE